MHPGDLILFSSDRSIMRFVLRFTHVGVVVGDNRVLEMHAEGDAGTDGLENLLGNGSVHKLYRLDERLAAYPGRAWIAPIRHRLPPLSPILLQPYAYHTAYVAHYLRSCVLCLRPSKAPTSVSCAEFVAIVLRDAFKIDVGSGETHCFTPASLAALHETFENPVRLYT